MPAVQPRSEDCRMAKCFYLPLLLAFKAGAVDPSETLMAGRNELSEIQGVRHISLGAENTADLKGRVSGATATSAALDLMGNLDLRVESLEEASDLIRQQEEHLLLSHHSTVRQDAQAERVRGLEEDDSCGTLSSFSVESSVLDIEGCYGQTTVTLPNGIVYSTGAGVLAGDHIFVPTTIEDRVVWVVATLVEVSTSVTSTAGISLFVYCISMDTIATAPHPADAAYTCDVDGDGVIAEVPTALELSIDCGCSESTCPSGESFSLFSTVLPDTQGCYEQFRNSDGFPAFTNAGAELSTGDDVIIAVEVSDSPTGTGEYVWGLGAVSAISSTSSQSTILYSPVCQTAQKFTAPGELHPTEATWGCLLDGTSDSQLEPVSSDDFSLTCNCDNVRSSAVPTPSPTDLGDDDGDGTTHGETRAPMPAIGAPVPTPAPLGLGDDDGDDVAVGETSTPSSASRGFVPTPSPTDVGDDDGEGATNGETPAPIPVIDAPVPTPAPIGVGDDDGDSVTIGETSAPTTDIIAPDPTDAPNGAGTGVAPVSGSSALATARREGLTRVGFLVALATALGLSVVMTLFA